MLDSLHDQLCLNGQRLIFFLIHFLFIDHIDVDLLAIFNGLENSFLGKFFSLLFIIQIFSSLLLTHPKKLLFEFIPILSPSNCVSLFFHLRVVHVVL